MHCSSPLEISVTMILLSLRMELCPICLHCMTCEYKIFVLWMFISPVAFSVHCESWKGLCSWMRQRQVSLWDTKIWFINRVDNVNWPPYRDWKADVLSVSPASIRSDEGLTLETSAFQSLYGGQFTLSTLLINQIFVYHSPTHAAPQFL